MLFDEPLSNLDAKLRDQLRADLHRLHARLGFTGVYVTHDQDEALALADRVAIMRAGRIEQLDVPEAVFTRPRTEYVASFIGIDNVVELRKPDGRWSFADGEIYGPMPDVAGDVARLRIRREDIKLYTSPASLAAGETAVSGATVVDVSFAGRQRAVALELGNARIAADLDATADVPAPGDAVLVAFKTGSALVFDEAGEAVEPRRTTSAPVADVAEKVGGA
jgi:iron(III) transport system ATP-binding protein